jgi:ATP-dependent DNA helicase RecQ
MIGYAMSTTCLRRRILRYFGQTGDELADTCETCSVCGWKEPRAVTPAVSGVREERVAFDEEGEELFQRLRTLRKRIADESGLRPYMVFSDATLRDMVRRSPSTKDELLAVTGVGEVKLERYGDAFLEEIRDFGSPSRS